MSTKGLSKESIEKKDADATDNERSTSNQAFMSGALKDWLGNVTARNHSGESVKDLLSEEQYPRKLSVANEFEGRRHSKKSSRSSYVARAKSSHKVARNRGGIPGPEATVESSKIKRLRISAVIPFILSATAFGFSLVLILAGSKAGYLTTVNIISVSHKAPLFISFLNMVYSRAMLII